MSTNYTYVHDQAVIIITASNEANAYEILRDLVTTTTDWNWDEEEEQEAFHIEIDKEQ